MELDVQPPPLAEAAHEQESDGDEDADGDFDLEGELDDLVEEDKAEVEESVAHAQAQAEFLVAGDATEGAELVDVGLARGPEPEGVAEVVQELSQDLADASLVDEVGPLGNGSASSSDAPASAPNAFEAPPSAQSMPWERLSEVSPLGYVYDSGRSVMRIQRGKPKNSVTVNCYKHSRCTVLLTEARCPSDMELKKWLFAVEPPAPGCSIAEAKELASRHMSVGKAQWTARGGASSGR